ncbi:hypothetical protein OGAPHI_005356 [Ogataea philodendri]|uniref:Uncharacterized protein n=1 Tax=Ogataea philodendri TaxID=1378263 RepID=A0A9P8T323_9ASCO|nr:uncharacterized protein OGAPHI_005356 [Ogataea philodendri]KAH3663366.1 hypothetical protein OGAPHI_005356 [Ogataea philodendri]
MNEPSRCWKITNRNVHPGLQRLVSRGPSGRVVAKDDLEREVDQHSDGQVFSGEPFIKQFEVGCCLVGLECDLGHQVHQNEQFHVLQFDHVPHLLVHADQRSSARRLAVRRVDLGSGNPRVFVSVELFELDILWRSVFVDRQRVFWHEQRNQHRHQQVDPPPKRHVLAERQHALCTGGAPQVRVGKVRGVEGQEHGETEEIARVEADCLGRGRVTQRILGQDRQGPAVHGNVLRCTQQDQKEECVCEGVEVFLHIEHDVVDECSEHQQRESGNGLHGDDPGPSSADFLEETRVHDRRPQQFQRVGVRRQGEHSDLGVGELARFEQERHRPERKADGDSLDQVQHHQQKEPGTVLHGQVFLRGIKAMVEFWVIGHGFWSSLGGHVAMDARRRRVRVVVAFERVRVQWQHVRGLAHGKNNFANKSSPIKAYTYYFCEFRNSNTCVFASWVLTITTISPSEPTSYCRLPSFGYATFSSKESNHSFTLSMESTPARTCSSNSDALVLPSALASPSCVNSSTL